jgi:hypothetical protein
MHPAVYESSRLPGDARGTRVVATTSKIARRRMALPLHYAAA